MAEETTLVQVGGVLRKVVVTGDEARGWTVTCPSAPGAVVVDSDRERALARMPAAIIAALEKRRR